MKKILISLLLLSKAILAQDLGDFLHLDRYCYYLDELANRIQNNGREDLAEVLRSVSPEEVWDSPISKAAMAKTSSYDEITKKLLEHIIEQRQLQIPLTAGDVKWDYNFFKNKLQTKYKEQEFKVNYVNLPEAISTPIEPEIKYQVPQINVNSLTLNAEDYISDRMTRAIFWDVAKNGTDMRFFFMPHEDFINYLERHHATIESEVKPYGNNYNKIYRVRMPGESDPVTVITSIDGKERLDHLIKQLDIISWRGTKASAKFPQRKVTVIGDPDTRILWKSHRFAKKMKSLPKADRVIIGQLGAITRSFRTAAKAEAIVRLYNQHPERFNGKLDTKFKNIVEEMNASNDFYTAIDDASSWDKIYAKMESSFGDVEKAKDPQIFNLENSSHDISDFTFKDSQGKIKRWRVISNMWGDEIVPVIVALKETGHKKISYIGTAGTFDGIYSVGDLVMPKEFKMPDGSVISIENSRITPPDAINSGRVGHVGSIFDESIQWMNNNIQQGVTAVEIETSYLAEAFRAPGETLDVFLLISDVIGSAHETLNNASSSRRKKSQLNVIKSIFAADKAKDLTHNKEQTGLASSAEEKIERWVDELAGNNNESYKFHLVQHAKEANATSKEKVKTIMSSRPVYSDNFFGKKAKLLGSAVFTIDRMIRDSAEDIKLAISDDFVRGLWNPKKDKLDIELKTANIDEFERIRSEFIENNPVFSKLVNIKHAETFSANMMQFNEELDQATIIRKYSANIFAEQGINLRIAPSGNFNFVVLPGVRKGIFWNDANNICETILFQLMH